MPSLAEELAALREKGSVKQHASNLSGAAALGTPEAEEAALSSRREKTKVGKKRAIQILNKGASGGGMSQELEHSLEQNEKKKIEQKKKKEAVSFLSKGASFRNPTNIGEPQVGGRNTSGPFEDDDMPELEAKPQEEAPEVEGQKSTALSSVTPIGNNGDDNEPELEETCDIPDLEEPGVEATSESVEPETRSVTNRNEKKARKMMQRLGMRPISGIERVTLKMGGGKGFFFIDQPSVFAASGRRSDTYVFFGEARQGANESQQQQQMVMAQQQAAAVAAGGVGLPKVKEQPLGMESTFEAIPDPIKKEGPAVDESGVDSKDVDLIMSQASCSRAKAVAALKDSDGDLVNAIMSLSM